MFPFPFELKLEIASKHEDAWFRMWEYDEEFRCKSNTESIRKIFVESFSVFNIDNDETVTWRLLGKKHREGDLPAVIYKTEHGWRRGSQEWWIGGNLHRENDQPAVIHETGMKEWWIRGNCCNLVILI